MTYNEKVVLREMNRMADRIIKKDKKLLEELAKK